MVPGPASLIPLPPPPSTPAFDFAKCWQEAWSSSDEENEQRYREYAEGRWEEGPPVTWEAGPDVAWLEEDSDVEW